MTITLDAPAATPAAAEQARPGAHPNSSRTVAVLVVVATVAVAFAQRDAVGSALGHVNSPRPGWVAMALVATAGGWVAGTACQVGSLPVTPPLGEFLAVQVAANGANNVVPGGVGGMLVNLRFLNRYGVCASTVVGAFALNSASGALAHAILLGAAAVLVPQPMAAVLSAVPVGPAPLLATGFVVALGLLALFGRRPSRWTHVARFADVMQRQRSVLRTVCLDRRRAGALWAGSFAIPLLHASALYAAARAVGVEPGVGAVVVAYLLVAAISSLVPSPGGVGAFDVLLPAALVATGLHLEGALAAAVAYRLITVWLPLLPSGALLAILVRRRLL